MASVWTHKLLNGLRQIGDPELDCTASEGGGWKRIPAAGNDGATARKDLHDPAAMAGLLRLWRGRELGALPGEAYLEQETTRAPDPEASILETFWSTPATGIDPVRLRVARDLFIEYGGEIGATLLLASLPNAYAGEVGSAVLANTDELRSNTRRRIGETAQFVVEVLFPEPELVYGDPLGGWDLFIEDQAVPRGSRGYTRIRTTRLTHSIIRTIVSSREVRERADLVHRWDPLASARIPAFQDESDPDLHVLRGVPINQEDLLGTLATFTVTVFEVMEKLGLAWNDDAEQAYLDLWDQVAELLGIGTASVTDALATAGIEVPSEYQGRLRPKTPAEARELCELIRARSWPLPLPGRVLGPFAGANGKILVRALLDELQAAMPRGLERMPLVVMRYLVDERAHELLGLGGGHLAEALLRLPASDRLGRTPMRRRGHELVQHGMRLAANDISRRAFVYFIQQKALDPNGPQFRFPGIPAEFADMSRSGRAHGPASASAEPDTITPSTTGP